MIIDNFKCIEEFMEFSKEQDVFYKFECMIRNTDGDNSIYRESLSSSKKNIPIKQWYVDSQEYYDNIKHEMIELCHLTHARLYMALDRKVVKKVLAELSHAYTDRLVDLMCGTKITVRTLAKAFSSKTSVVETSEHGRKTVMFDLDTKDTKVLEFIKDYVKSHGQYPFVLETRQGYHVFCYKKFNITDWSFHCTAAKQCFEGKFTKIVEQKLKEYIESLHQRFDKYEIDEKRLHILLQTEPTPNRLGLVYMEKTDDSNNS